jgi:hypothetical protein
LNESNEREEEHEFLSETESERMQRTSRKIALYLSLRREILPFTAGRMSVVSEYNQRSE